MAKRSPYDHSHPAPSEELLGIVHGIQQAGVTPETGVEALKHWMIQHLSESELERLSVRDLLWDFENSAGEDNSGGMTFFVEWGKRVKDGERLFPLPGMRYQAKLKVVENERTRLENGSRYQ